VSCFLSGGFFGFFFFLLLVFKFLKWPLVTFVGQTRCIFQLNEVYARPVSTPSEERVFPTSSVPEKVIKLPACFLSVNCGKPFRRKCEVRVPTYHQDYYALQKGAQH